MRATSAAASRDASRRKRRWATTPRSFLRSKARRSRPASTRSGSTTKTRSRRASRWSESDAVRALREKIQRGGYGEEILAREARQQTHGGADNRTEGATSLGLARVESFFDSQSN